MALVFNRASLPFRFLTTLPVAITVPRIRHFHPSSFLISCKFNIHPTLILSNPVFFHFLIFHFLFWQVVHFLFFVRHTTCQCHLHRASNHHRHSPAQEGYIRFELFQKQFTPTSSVHFTLTTPSPPHLAYPGNGFELFLFYWIQIQINGLSNYLCPSVQNPCSSVFLFFPSSRWNSVGPSPNPPPFMG